MKRTHPLYPREEHSSSNLYLKKLKSYRFTWCSQTNKHSEIFKNFYFTFFSLCISYVLWTFTNCCNYSLQTVRSANRAFWEKSIYLKCWNNDDNWSKFCSLGPSFHKVLWVKSDKKTTTSRQTNLIYSQHTHTCMHTYTHMNTQTSMHTLTTHMHIQTQTYILFFNFFF